MPKWQTVITVALLIYCAGIIFFAVHQTDGTDVGWAEWVAATLAGISIIMLIAYMVPSVLLPGENYAYLMVGYAGSTTMLLYLIDTSDEAYRRTGIAAFLLSGALTGYGAFLAQGRSGAVRDG